MTSPDADPPAGPARLEQRLVELLPELEAFLRLQMGVRMSQLESASDLCQSVCREILDDLPDLEDRGAAAFKKLLFLRARRKIADRARFHGRQRRDSDRVEVDERQEHTFHLGAVSLLTASREAMAREELARIARGIESLPDEQRKVLTLCRGLGLTPAEAAEELGKSPNAVRIALHRGLVRLAFLLEDEDS